MKFSTRLLALFVLIPAAELMLLLYMGGFIGVWATIGLIVFTGLIGSRMALREGASVWQRLLARISSGDLPGDALLDGVIILISGALLITPGIITDLAGFLGLIPATRSVIRRWAALWIRRTALHGADYLATQPPRAEEDAPTWQGTAHDQPSYTREPRGDARRP